MKEARRKAMELAATLRVVRLSSRLKSWGRVDGEANSLSLHLLEYQPHECQGHVQRIYEFPVTVLYQLLSRCGIVDEAEKQKFPLEREIAGSNDKGVLECNKVVTDDDIDLILHSTKVDKSEDDIDETSEELTKIADAFGFEGSGSTCSIARQETSFYADEDDK
ncbi:hypothetical protein AXG93_2190s1190 [Marchantia polymorpha subsp. ruderalis]|uniref:Uncharacterized protein n=1 Tax=Marchantia polymorpha subsp. ruderalis TaxID=1480154 RepID=A0A176WGU1_MARPO|nr:hypothetical protein AXG93_2190s1190 [Marchantia polymorpha subsp. ruderalis]